MLNEGDRRENSASYSTLPVHIVLTVKVCFNCPKTQSGINISDIQVQFNFLLYSIVEYSRCRLLIDYNDFLETLIDRPRPTTLLSPVIFWNCVLSNQRLAKLKLMRIK